MTFRNYNEGSVTTRDIINSNLTAGTDSSGNQKLTFNISNDVTAQFNGRDWDQKGSVPSELAYLDQLKSQISSDKLNLQPIEFTEQSWNDATRGLTTTAVVTIVVAAVVISCVLTACTTAPQAAGSGVAAGGTAATAGAGTGAAAGGAAAGTTAAATTGTVAAGAAGGTAAGVGTGAAVGGGFSWAAVGSAALTAGATTAATTATISGINASMNADGSIWSQIKTTADTSYKTTTSNESLKNIVLAAALAALSNATVQASGGSTTLEQGKDYAVYKPSEEMIKADPVKYSNYNGVIDPSVNNIGVANIAPNPNMVGQPVPAYSTNPFTNSFWDGFLKESGFISNGANKLGGMNAMSTMHDPLTNNIVMSQTPILQISILPAIAVQYCATFPAACGTVVSGSMNNDFGTKQ